MLAKLCESFLVILIFRWGVALLIFFLFIFVEHALYKYIIFPRLISMISRRAGSAYRFLFY